MQTQGGRFELHPTIILNSEVAWGEGVDSKALAYTAIAFIGSTSELGGIVMSDTQSGVQSSTKREPSMPSGARSSEVDQGRRGSQGRRGAGRTRA
jgi:hypothetical protein